MVAIIRRCVCIVGRVDCAATFVAPTVVKETGSINSRLAECERHRSVLALSRSKGAPAIGRPSLPKSVATMPCNQGQVCRAPDNMVSVFCAQFIGDAMGTGIVYLPPPTNIGFGRLVNGSWTAGIFKDVRKKNISHKFYCVASITFHLYSCL